jgi:hypothetical protein
MRAIFASVGVMVWCCAPGPVLADSVPLAVNTASSITSGTTQTGLNLPGTSGDVSFSALASQLGVLGDAAGGGSSSSDTSNALSDVTVGFGVSGSSNDANAWSSGDLLTPSDSYVAFASGGGGQTGGNADRPRFVDPLSSQSRDATVADLPLDSLGSLPNTTLPTVVPLPMSIWGSASLLAALVVYRQLRRRLLA